jgi:hypothetical protein
MAIKFLSSSDHSEYEMNHIDFYLCGFYKAIYISLLPEKLN